MRLLRSFLVASLLLGIAFMFGCSGGETGSDKSGPLMQGKEFKNKKSGETKQGLNVVKPE